jgi:UDP:flavonoid glycosyltransferase YjiC (YdhE family)
MEKILFGIVGWNIAETTRMIEVAQSFSERYECHFFSYGGQFEHLVEEAGFILHHLEPIEDEQKIELLWKVDRGETFKQPWTYEELKARIKHEVELIERLNPSFAFLGSVLTFSLSCKIKNLKLFNLIPLALSKAYLEAGLPISPFIPRWLNKIAIWVLLKVPLLIGNFRRVAKYYGLEKPRNALDIWSGDINIVADVKEFSLLKKLPENWYFSGPLFAHLKQDIPEETKQLLIRTKKPKIYFAMGSSANHKILTKALSAFDGLDVCVVAPIQSHLKKDDKIPKNVIVTDWLPALEVMKYVDIAVTHGGQGTVQTSVISGKPFLGIGMQPEQELNIYPFVRYGNALQISKRRVNQKAVQVAIHTLLNDENFHKKAKEAQVILEKNNTLEIVQSIVSSHIK